MEKLSLISSARFSLVMRYCTNQQVRASIGTSNFHVMHSSDAPNKKLAGPLTLVFYAHRAARMTDITQCNLSYLFVKIRWNFAIIIFITRGSRSSRRSYNRTWLASKSSRAGWLSIFINIYVTPGFYTH